MRKTDKQVTGTVSSLKVSIEVDSSNCMIMFH